MIEMIIDVLISFIVNRVSRVQSSLLGFLCILLSDVATLLYSIFLTVSGRLNGGLPCAKGDEA